MASLLTRKQVAAALRVSARSINTWQRQGMPVVRPDGSGHGRVVLFDLQAVRAWQERTGRGLSIQPDTQRAVRGAVPRGSEGAEELIFAAIVEVYVRMLEEPASNVEPIEVVLLLRDFLAGVQYQLAGLRLAHALVLFLNAHPDQPATTYKEALAQARGALAKVKAAGLA